MQRSRWEGERYRAVVADDYAQLGIFKARQGICHSTLEWWDSVDVRSREEGLAWVKEKLAVHGIVS